MPPAPLPLQGAFSQRDLQLGLLTAHSALSPETAFPFPMGSARKTLATLPARSGPVTVAGGRAVAGILSQGCRVSAILTTQTPRARLVRTRNNVASATIPGLCLQRMHRARPHLLSAQACSLKACHIENSLHTTPKFT